MQTEFVVQTKNLCKAFAGKEVIHDCTMSVERGTIYNLVGAALFLVIGSVAAIIAWANLKRNIANMEV